VATGAPGSLVGISIRFVRQEMPDMDFTHPSALRPLRTPAALTEAGLWLMAVLYLLKALATPLATNSVPPVVLAFFLWTGLAVLGWVYTIATFLVWLYQARENLDLRGEQRMRWAKGWTIGGWFIPFANLVIPARVVGEVYARSEPGGGPVWRMPRLVLVWWLAFILGIVRFTYQSVGPDRVIHVYGAEFWNLVNGVAGAVAAVLAVRIVRRITAWQAEPVEQPSTTSDPRGWR
jgi:hypothetical protein